MFDFIEEERSIADISYKDKRILLFCAAVTVQPEIIDLLITKYKLDVNAQNEDGKTLLYTIVEKIFNKEKINIKIAECLINRGADVNVKDNLGHTLLHNIIMSINLANLSVEKYISLIKFLIDSGAYVDLKGKQANTFLHLVIENKNTNILLFLLQNKVCFNTKIEESGRLLYIAIQDNNTDAVEYLINLGINIEDRDESGATFLHRICSNRKISAEKNLEIAQKLIAQGADPRATDDSLFTVLHYAVLSFQPKVISFLIDKYRLGFNDDENPDQETPLHILTKAYLYIVGTGCYIDDYKFAETVKCLLENGANINSQDDMNRTIFHYLTNNNFYINELEELVGYFYNKNIDIKTDIKDINGNTCLHTLVLNNKLDLNAQSTIEIQKTLIRLLSFGVKEYQIKNNNGKTAYDLALTLGKKKLANYLKERGEAPLTLQDLSLNVIKDCCSQEAVESLPIDIFSKMELKMRYEE